MIQRTDDGGRLITVRVRAPPDLGQRPQGFDFRRPDHLEGDADGVGGTAVFLILIHAVAVGGEAQVARDVKAHVLSCFLRQPLVQIHRVFVELPDGVAHIEERQQSRRMPGGSSRQFGPLQEHDVGPPLQG
jgi:hypothetical protein